MDHYATSIEFLLFNVAGLAVFTLLSFLTAPSGFAYDVRKTSAPARVLLLVFRPKKNRLCGGLLWSERRDSNPQQLPWEGRILPLNYFRIKLRYIIYVRFVFCNRIYKKREIVLLSIFA